MDKGGIHRVDWVAVNTELEAGGSVVVAGLIDPAGCDALTALYQPGEAFRIHVVMASAEASIAISRTRYPGVVQHLR